MQNNFANNFTDQNHLSICLIMAGINRICCEANRKILDQHPGEVIECKSHDEYVDD